MYLFYFHIGRFWIILNSKLNFNWLMYYQFLVSFQ